MTAKKIEKSVQAEDKKPNAGKATVDMGKVRMALANQKVCDQKGKRGKLEKAPRIAIVSEDDIEGKFPILGWQVGFSLSQMMVPHDVLKGYYKDVGLDDKYLPPKTNPKDAFENATRERERVVTIPFAGHQIRATYLVREVNKTRRHLVREISLANIDEKQQQLEYVQLLAWEFDAETKKPKVIVLDDTEDTKAVARKEHAEMMERFTLYTQCYSEKNLRDNLRNILKDCQAIPFLISRGGVWLLSDEYRPLLKKMESVFQTLMDNHQDGDRSRFRILPLADGEKTRKWVQEDVEEQLNDQLSKLLQGTLDNLAETETIVKKDNETDEKYRERIARKESNIAERADREMSDMKALKEHFEKLLGRKISVTLNVPDDQKKAIAKSSRAQQIMQAFGEIL